ncbi:hypothetical protein CYMTET_38039 [Cymbomonas tetramitiformis]|uniref:Uncharacterized protein n=1 Tax=Cymbomonas tetramitiformis TaxID=36881 RepID=A0AAE0CCS1_9CHLO|nr:hypothetical protein CYMTET_38039 [Cymbomonas tetramitiformis]
MKASGAPLLTGEVIDNSLYGSLEVDDEESQRQYASEAVAQRSPFKRALVFFLVTLAALAIGLTALGVVHSAASRSNDDTYYVYSVVKFQNSGDFAKTQESVDKLVISQKLKVAMAEYAGVPWQNVNIASERVDDSQKLVVEFRVKFSSSSGGSREDAEAFKVKLTTHTDDIFTGSEFDSYGTAQCGFAQSSAEAQIAADEMTFDGDWGDDCFGNNKVTHYNADKAFNGYTLFGHVPSSGFNGVDYTYLINMAGQLVHYWWHPYAPDVKVSRLLENGNLLRLSWLPNAPFVGTYDAAGAVQEMDWDGRIVAECIIKENGNSTSPAVAGHHDAVKVADGRYLVLVWRIESKEFCFDLGLNPDSHIGSRMFQGNPGDDTAYRPYDSEGCMIDGIVEYEAQQGDAIGECTKRWEWWMDDHVVQDFYPQNNETYSNPAYHPRLIDINYWLGMWNDQTSFIPPQTLHLNAIDYNADLDQVMTSSFNKGEIYIIDHSTTTAEAKGSTGGKLGFGGDLAYRYGNPAAYRRGKEGRPFQTMFKCHSAYWVPKGLPGAGNIMYFDNGFGQGDSAPQGFDFSSAAEITPPINASTGQYFLEHDGYFGPNDLTWHYDDDACQCTSDRFGGVQRLPNGNTLLTHSYDGFWLKEVTKEGKVVWEFMHPDTWSDWAADAHAESFRAWRYSANYTGLKGKILEPICKANFVDDCFGNDLPCRNMKNSTFNDIPAPRTLTQNIHGPPEEDFELSAPPPHTARRDISSPEEESPTPDDDAPSPDEDDSPDPYDEEAPPDDEEEAPPEDDAPAPNYDSGPEFDPGEFDTKPDIGEMEQKEECTTKKCKKKRKKEKKEKKNN